VTLVDIPGSAGLVLHPRGTVAVVITSPSDAGRLASDLGPRSSRASLTCAHEDINPQPVPSSAIRSFWLVECEGGARTYEARHG
jgi:hypothetical protein